MSTIHKDDEGVWHGYVVVGVRSDGRPDRRHRRGRTRAEVTRKVRELEQERDAGTVRAPGGTFTVSQWVEHYIDVVKGDALAPRTATSYRGHLREWIGPHVGRLTLPALSVEDVEQMFAAMRKAGLSAASCERVRATLRAAMTVAVRRGLVARNVATLATVGFRDERQDVARPLTVDEVGTLTATIAGRDDEARWLLALLGMRPGEVLGLDWAAVDLDDGWVHVRQQLVVDYPFRHGCADGAPCREQPAAGCAWRRGGRMLTGLKSFESRRSLALPDRVVEALTRRRAAWLIERATAATWDESWGELVFTGPEGAPVATHSDRKAWNALLDEAGLHGRRLYDARHTAATLLVAHGADIQQVKEQLGHAQITTSSRYYVGRSVESARSAADKLAKAMG